MTERKPSWAQSVKRARKAITASFEGRMEAADASFDQIPPHGKGATKTLGEFAEAVGIEEPTIKQWRQVWEWFGRDRMYVHTITGYSVAFEAMTYGDANRKPWTAEEFVGYIEATDPPEPFKFWGVEAIRTEQGRMTTKPRPRPRKQTLFQGMTRGVSELWDVSERLKDELPTEEDLDLMLMLVDGLEQFTAWIRTTLQDARTKPDQLDWDEFEKARQEGRAKLEEISK